MARRGRRSGRYAVPNESLPRDPLVSLFSMGRPVGYGAQPHVGPEEPYVEIGTFNPVPVTTPARVTAVPSQKRPSRFPSKSDANVFAGYAAEDRVREQHLDVCVERSQRREVLHAMKVAGKSGLSGPRYSKKSAVKC